MKSNIINEKSDTITKYFKEVRESEVLTIEKEVKLLNRIQNGDKLEVFMLNLTVGKVYIVTKRGEECGFGPERSKATIKIIDQDNLNVGLEFEIRNTFKFHNLNGLSEDGKGYWVTMKEFDTKNFFVEEKKEKVIIKNGTKLGVKDISNKYGKIIMTFSNGENVMVELEENVGAYSGDGIGKAGHCIIVEKNNINFKKTEENNL